jgi:preprotein translocase subunit SecY
MIVALYRSAPRSACPGVDPFAIDQIRRAPRTARSVCSTCSPAAPSELLDLRPRDHAVHHASIIMQVLGVVIPKLEELQQEGAVGQRKITQYTRYVTIALATLQATVLVFLFGTAAAVRSTRRCRLPRCRCFRWHLAARLPDHPHARGRHRAVDVDG